RRARDLAQFLQILELLVNEQFGITDDVDEQNMPDFELHIGFGRHAISLPRSSESDETRGRRINEMRNHSSGDFSTRLDAKVAFAYEPAVEVRESASVFQSASRETGWGQSDVAAVHSKDRDGEGDAFVRIQLERRGAFMPRRLHSRRRRSRTSGQRSRAARGTAHHDRPHADRIAWPGNGAIEAK